MVDFSLIGLAPEECRTLVDVGANAGQFLYAALRYYKPQRIVAIEMLPDLAALLRRDTRVEVVECAVGERAGHAAVLRSVHSEASSLRVLNPEASNWYGRDLMQFVCGQVPVRRLDDICAELGIDTVDLLKIDAQGFEDAVLRGATKTLAATRRIMIEVEYVPVYEGQALTGEIYKQVEAAGFEYVCNLTEYRSSEGTLLHADALFRR